MEKETVSMTKKPSFVLNAMLLTDGYKLGHKNMYAKGMSKLYTSFIPRSNKHFAEASNGVVVFGIQYFIKKILIDAFNEDFFNLPEEEVVSTYRDLLVSFVGQDVADMIGTDHIRALHKLSYLPIRIKALKEGSMCPIGVPVLTIESTHKDFAWFAEYLETIMSNELWLPMTSATTADAYMRELKRHADKTGLKGDLRFLCHDFSMRGMQGLDSTIQSGMGHLTSFIGSESIPAIAAANYYYPGKSQIAGTVPASEHSVMCSTIMEYMDEINNGLHDDVLNLFKEKSGLDGEEAKMGAAEYMLIKHMITEVVPTGFISLVSDSFDFWRVIDVIIPMLHDEIMARDGRVVIRPDSGDPVKIVSGDPDGETWNQRIGAYAALYNEFGGTINKKGYKVLDSHIGLLYGDSINLTRQHKIYEALENSGFTASNLVLGIGSYTYCLRTRDSLGFAMKANWCEVDGKGIEIYKDPKTVVGMPKKSLKGLIRVDWKDANNHAKGIAAYDQQNRESEQSGLLKVVYTNGHLIKNYSLDEIRETLDNFRNGYVDYE